MSSDQDSLLECLDQIACMHGRQVNREGIVAGLPLVEGRLTPSLFQRAASRLRLKSRVAQFDVELLAPEQLPIVLLLDKGEAIVLRSMDDERQTVEIYRPFAEKNVQLLPLDEVAALQTGMMIFVTAEFEFDERAPAAGPSRRRHWFWGAIFKNRRLYVDALLAAVVINLFALAMPLFVMNVYDRVVPNQAVETLWVFAIGVVIVLISDVALRTTRAHFLDLAGNRVDVELSTQIMERVLGMRMQARPQSVGSFAASLRSFEMVRDFITAATVTALIDLPFALLFIAIIAWIGLPLVVPILIGAALVLAYALSVQASLRHLADATYRSGAMRNATLVESLVGLESIKSQGAESVMQRKWEQSAAHLARVTTQLKLLGSSTINMAMWTQHMTSISVVVLGVFLVIDQKLSMGGLIAAMMLTSRAMSPLAQVAGLATQFHNTRTALEGLNEVMNGPVERPEHKQFISRPRFEGRIALKDVSFHYPGDERSALHHVSLSIKRGEKVAVLGRVGSGKSTLFRLLLGLYEPDSGAITMDGVDIRQLDPAQLRANIGYVPQDATLFYGSLRENITMGRATVSDEDLIRAARIAAIDDMVDAHPQGFDMLIGERGESLSGGQRQAVALARGVVADPPILLLDEPTGSMDHGSEEAVKSRLLDYVRDKTLIVVTHRTSLLSLVDRILVTDGGRIVADGPKDQVVAALKQGKIGRGGP